MIHKPAPVSGRWRRNGRRIPRALLLLAASLLLVSAIPLGIVDHSLDALSHGSLRPYPPYYARVRGLLRLAAFVLATLGVIALLTDRCGLRWRRARFPVLLALSFVLFIAGYRFLIGAGLGPRPGSGGAREQSTGLILNHRDHLSYASWARQAADGRVRLQDLYTTEPHEAIYVNPYFSLVGGLARLTGASVLAVMHVLGLAAAFVVILLTYRCSLLAGLSRTNARWAALLGAWGSGVSVPLIVLSKILGLERPVGTDLSYHDSVMFTTIGMYPFHAMGLALVALIVMQVLRCEREAPGRPIRRVEFLGLAGTACILVWVHPYEMFLPVAAYPLAALLSWAFLGAHPSRRTVATACALAAGTAPPTLYNAWVATQPVWRDFARRASLTTHTRLTWLVGYGLFLPAFLLGSVLVLRSARRWRAVWFVCWVLLLFVLLLGLETRFTRVVDGVCFPLCIVAGLGWDRLTRGTLHREKRPWRLSRAFLWTATAMFFTTPVYVLVVSDPFMFDRGLIDVADSVKRVARAEVPAVLCDTRAGVLLPALTGLRVYAGHYALTPRFSDKMSELLRAGIEPPSPGQAERPPDRRVFLDLLEGSGSGFLLLRDSSPAMGFTASLPGLRPLAAPEPWHLFAITRPSQVPNDESAAGRSRGPSLLDAGTNRPAGARLFRLPEPA